MTCLSHQVEEPYWLSKDSQELSPPGGQNWFTSKFTLVRAITQSSIKRILPKFCIHVYHIKRKNPIDCQIIPMSYLPLAAETDFLQIYCCPRDNSSSSKRILPKFGIHVYHIKRKNHIDCQNILVSYLPLATETDFFKFTLVLAITQVLVSRSYPNMVYMFITSRRRTLLICKQIWWVISPWQPKQIFANFTLVRTITEVILNGSYPNSVYIFNTSRGQNLFTFKKFWWVISPWWSKQILSLPKWWLPRRAYIVTIGTLV